MATTRLSLDGYGARRAGSFAGKASTPGVAGPITRLSLDGYGVRRAGVFGGKTPGVGTGGDSSWVPRHRRRRR